MILYINTTLDNQLEVALFDQFAKQFDSLKCTTDRDESEKLITTIDKVLRKVKEGIEGIIVVKGPHGRFSAIRSGVTSANLLGFGWNVPVIGIKARDDIKMAAKQIIKFKVFQDPVIPIYEKNPNIG